MKKVLFCLIVLSACNDAVQQTETATTQTDTIQVTPRVDPGPGIGVTPEEPIEETQGPRVYFNTRFKEVTVKKTGGHQFVIKGKAQVFEANISWAVEDGHNELKKGFVTTDAGAPEWGNFNFTIDVKKERANSTLTLILFESSAKDGSRQHELPIVLY